MKMTTYKTVAGLVKAIRAIETTQPAKPVKGHGNERTVTTEARLGMVAALVGKETAGGNHFATVFARRSRTAYNPMQFGSDEYYLSPELNALLAANEANAAALVEYRNGACAWAKVVAP